ncbi:MAG: ribonuclease HII [Gammaproteobacteria bacterium HGW-Gammaproteobacteria-8]|nr:MAG: ribonuclease HII [Gammaproteobacteria bacterium HGW-Gammaproteobacteria-8]
MTVWIAGVDEAGRGPLAGPVVAAAVILDPRRPIEGLNDSKKLSARVRERLDGLIRERALGYAVAIAEVGEIDRINILQASLLAMRRALLALSPQPQLALIDGNRVPEVAGMELRCIVGGDASEPAIAAASILAKVDRDRRMQLLHQRYPDYGFDRHMGYPTAQHREALLRLGPTPEHRMSFAPLRQLRLKR